jgi:hypothetical protein
MRDNYQFVVGNTRRRITDGKKLIDVLSRVSLTESQDFEGSPAISRESLRKE